ncbi:MAG: hypothetical protein LBH51_01470 [Treponema sp.]|nr:hypothetical protein [Treponema sp.]
MDAAINIRGNRKPLGKFTAGGDITITGLDKSQGHLDTGGCGVSSTRNRLPGIGILCARRDP